MKQKIVSFVAILFIVGISFTVLIWIYRTGQQSERVKINGIAINEENFPNKWLRKVVDEKFDKNANHFLSDKERMDVREFTLFMGDDKTDILQAEWAHFPNLQKVTFELGGDQRRFHLRDIQNIKEVEFRILLGKTRIECSGMGELAKLKIYSEKKQAETFLTVNNSPALKTLYVEGEGIHTLTASAVPLLKKLEVRDTSVRNLDFCSGLPALKELTVTGYLDSLHLAGYRSLEELYVEGKFGKKTAGIPHFTLSDAPMLTELGLNNMEVETLDFHSLHKLERLSISDMNRLSKLIVYDLPKIRKVDIYDMPRLKGIDLNQLESLQEIYIIHVSAKVLNIDQCKKIWNIDVSGLDKIKNLDLRNQKDLGILRWENGKLESVLFGSKRELHTLDVENNRLSGKLDLSHFPELRDLICNDNSFREIIGVGHKHISYVSCENNKMQRIDLRGAKWIGAVCAKGNQGVRVYLPPKKVVEDNGGYYYFEPDRDIGSNAKVYYSR